MKWLQQLDRVLRGEGTRAEDLRGGRLGISARAMLVAIVGLGAFYGACMGCYNVLTGVPGAWLQIISSAIKVPALFLLTIGVTFPSLYVFNALVGSRLTLVNMLRLILAATGVMLAVLAGFGTIVGFFNFTTESYPFILFLNVVVFTVAGVLGLSFLLQTLRRLTEPLYDAVPPPPPSSETLPAPDAEADASGSGSDEAPDAPEPGAAAPALLAPAPTLSPGALTRVHDGPTAGSVKLIFRIWVVVFSLVGAQMSWVLRPFVGSYGTAEGGGEFVWFRPRGGNFFERVWDVVLTLVGIR